MNLLWHILILLLFISIARKSIKYILNGFYKDSIIKKILIAIKKCKFYIKKTNFIRFIIKLK